MFEVFLPKKVIKNVWFLLDLVVSCSQGDLLISLETNYDGVFTKLNFSVKMNTFLLYFFRDFFDQVMFLLGLDFEILFVGFKVKYTYLKSCLV
jgi:hypothetical protein